MILHRAQSSPSTNGFKLCINIESATLGKNQFTSANAYAPAKNPDAGKDSDHALFDSFPKDATKHKNAVVSFQDAINQAFVGAWFIASLCR